MAGDAQRGLEVRSGEVRGVDEGQRSGSSAEASCGGLAARPALLSLCSEEQTKAS